MCPGATTAAPWGGRRAGLAGGAPGPLGLLDAPPPDRGRGSAGEELAGAAVVARVAQLGDRAHLDLADALPGQVELLADLVERGRLARVEPEAADDDPALTVVERGEDLLDLARQHRTGRSVERRLCATVLDEVGQL